MDEYKIFSENLNREVRITVRTPLNYKEDEMCNIIYFHDGQNAFDDDKATFGNAWKIQDAVKNLELQNKIEPTFIVAIESNSENAGMERAREFSIFDNTELIEKLNNPELSALYQNGCLSARGNKYLEFVNCELLPWIEPRLSSNINVEQRIMVGSSLGGLITHTCGLLYPENFKYLIGLSNAYWYCEEQLTTLIKNTKPAANQTYYLDCGTNEGSLGLAGMDSIYIDTNTNINRVFKDNGFNTIFNIINDGIHHEADWSKRIELIFDEVLGGK